MTTRSRWGIPLTATICTLLGLFIGSMVAGGTGRREPTKEEGGEHGHAPQLPPATLANLGVRVGKVEPTTFVRTVAVAAVVTDMPTTEQPVFAPIGGRIESIDVEIGRVVEPGRVVITLVRDPLPRPQLTLTADVLRPAQEQLHSSVLDLRKSAEEVRIARTELERVEQYTGNVGGRDLPLIPRQRAIDLRYQLSRAEKEQEQARLELQKHGLTEEQIGAIEAGASIPELDEERWQRALARNGLWPPEAQRLSAALPKAIRSLPWVTATIGELAASGLVTPELTEWMATAEGALHFLDIGVLLQQGHTLEDLKRLHALNALEPVVRILAPALVEGAAWDVLEVLTKRGAKVAAGDRLLTLSDPRRLLLRTEPVGGEVAAVLAAAKERHGITGKPLIRDSGPALDGLRVGYVQSSNANEGTIAFIEVANSVSSTIEREGGLASRTWSLREGMSYLLSVPTAKLDNVYVLPSSAVTEDGPNKVVFLQDGDGFKPVPIAIVYQDDEVVVVPAGQGVALFPGDPVVQSGAFELGLALKGGDAVDAHAGHGH